MSEIDPYYRPAAEHSPRWFVDVDRQDPDMVAVATKAMTSDFTIEL